MATNFVAGQFYAADRTGAPLEGGLVYTYARGTTTLQATYTDRTLTVANTNPVVLDEFGRASIWMPDNLAYTVRVVNAEGTEQYQEQLDFPPSVSTGVVSPLAYGASLDPDVDSKAAIIAACATGKVVDGGGLTFGISGLMNITVLNALQNINFIQLNPAATNCRTIQVNGASNYRLEKIKIDMGSGFTIGGTASIAENAGIYCSGGIAVLRDIEVYNGGPSTAVYVSACSKVTADNIRIHDMQYDLAALTDDCIHGLYFSACTEFDAINCQVYAFSGKIAGVPSVRFHRGFVVGSGSSKFSFVNCHANSVNQGFDFTGGGGSTQWSVTNCTATDAGTWGFKSANTAYWGTYLGCHAIRCGWAGFVNSGAAGAADAGVLYTQDLKYIGCTATDTGSNGLWGSPKGFYTLSNSAVDATYPRKVKYIACSAVDNQSVKTMQYGFFSDIPLSASAILENYLTECFSSGHTVADISGFYSPRVEVRNANLQATANNTGYTVLFDTDVYDPLNGHSTVSQTDRVTVPYTGIWLIEASVAWTSNATGRRLIDVRKNGNPLPNGVQSIQSHGSGDANVEVAFTARLVAGDYLTVLTLQNSGGALDITSTFLTATLIRTTT